MSATIDAGAPSRPANPSLARAKVTFLRVLRSEWRKLFSLRSTWIMLGIGAVLTLGFAFIGALGMASIAASNDGLAGIAISTMVTELPTAGLPFGALLVAVAFTVNIAGEYNTHTIVSTLSAVPSRTPVYLAKALIAVFVAFVFGAVMHLGALGLVSLPFNAQGIDVDLSTEVTRQVLVSGVHVAVLALLGLALGALVRNTAGAIVSLVALVLVLSMVLAGLGALMPDAEWLPWLANHLPVESAEGLRPPSALADLAAQMDGPAVMERTTLDAGISTGVWVLLPLIGGWLSFKLRPVK